MKEATITGFVSSNHYYDFVMECNDRHVEVTGRYENGTFTGTYQGPSDALEDAAMAVGVFVE